MIPDFADSLRRAQRQHRAIIDAIRAREGARAEALAREHARLARSNLEYVMRERPRLWPTGCRASRLSPNTPPETSMRGENACPA